MVYAVLLLSSSVVWSRYHVVKTNAALQDVVDKYAYSVVCFAPSGQLDGESLDTDDKKERKKIFKSLQNVVKAASQQGEYKTYVSKDVGFIVVDLVAKQAEQIQHQYHVQNDPLCIVFEQGADTKAKVMRPASVKDLTNLLEAEGGDDLKDLIDDRKEDARLARQERIASYYAYATAYPYPYGYGPYYGWGPAWSPYWRSPYVGWGFYAGGW